MKTKKKFPDLNGDGKVTMADVLEGRGVKKAGEGMKYKDGGRVKKVLERAKKKAARIHEREATKEAKGKDVEVLGTKKNVVSVGPRLMDRVVEKKKVYAKERDAINKGDAKASKIEGKQATKTSRPSRVKPPKIKVKKGRRSLGGGKRADKPTGGGLKKFLQNRKNIRRNKKKGCFGNNC
jgi:hypothetical protein